MLHLDVINSYRESDNGYFSLTLSFSVCCSAIKSNSKKCTQQEDKKLKKITFLSSGSHLHRYTLVNFLICT